jgi:hypothetical protein
MWLDFSDWMKLQIKREGCEDVEVFEEINMFQEALFSLH